MVTNCRQPMLLRSVVSNWVSWNIPLVVSTNSEGAEALKGLPITILTRSVSKETHGSDLADAIEVAGSKAGWVLRQDDDIIPVSTDKLEQLGTLKLFPNSISGVRLVDPSGRRWYDWAKFDRAGASLLDYGTYEDNVYVTGGCQLYSREAISVVSKTYRANSRHRSASDAKVCLAAAAAGVRMISPSKQSPAFIHLDPNRMTNQPHKYSQNNIPNA